MGGGSFSFCQRGMLVLLDAYVLHFFPSFISRFRTIVGPILPGSQQRTNVASLAPFALQTSGSKRTEQSLVTVLRALPGSFSSVLSRRASGECSLLAATGKARESVVSARCSSY